jgi:WD40 repeat protein
MGHSGFVDSVAYSPDGRRIVSAAYDGSAEIWDAESGRLVRTLSRGFTSAVYSPGGRRIISGSSDGIIMWDAESGAEIAQFISCRDGEWLCFTPDNYYTASPGGEKYLAFRKGDAVYGMENYRAEYNKPDIVRSRLAEKE